MANIYVKDQAEVYIEDQIEQSQHIVDQATTLYNNSMSSLASLVKTLSDIGNVNLPEFTVDAMRHVHFNATAPVWSDTTVPTPRTAALDSYVAIPKIVGVSFPDAPNDVLPVTDIKFIEELYYSSLLETYKTYLANGLSGGSGIPDAYEEAIYNRDAIRRDREADRTILEIGTAFAAKGFSRPSGAYSAAVAQVTRDKSIALADASRDAMVKRTELEQQFVATLNQAIPQIESILVDYHNKVEDRKVVVERSSVENAIDAWKNTLQRYTTLMEAARIEADLSIAQVTAATETNKGIAAVNSLRLEETKAKFDMAIAQMDGEIKAFDASVSSFQAQIDKYKTDVDSDVRQYEAKVTSQAKEVEMAIKAAEVSMQALIGTKTIVVDAAKANSSVSAQVLASALNSINTAISYGYSGNLSSNYSNDNTKTIPSGAQTINYHYFDQTSAQ